MKKKTDFEMADETTEDPLVVPGAASEEELLLFLSGVMRGQLAKAFFSEAEALRLSDERAYRHEYLGEAIGTGGNVFENLALRTITDEELESFDHIYMGVDWGFAPDPYAFIRLHYDPARETIFLPDELHALQKTNSETADELLTRGYTDAVITCDSAEPKSVADYRSLGLKAGNVSNAVKNAQALLIRHGYACGGRIIAGRETPDGEFGPVTERAEKASSICTDSPRMER